jgi:hypothetical protein
MLPYLGVAQQHIGHISDELSGEPLRSVLITNTHSGALWLSDSGGNVAFTAYPGDVIRFSHPGYKEAKATITGYNDGVTIGLTRAPIELKGVTVESPLARFQRDTAFNHQYFHKELGYAHSQVRMEGMGASGLISELALRATGRKKAARRLEEEMLFLEGMQYSYIRYNAAMVTAQTGLKDTAAEAFIARHPIPNEYLQAASELELKQHIRDMYREELKADSLKKQQALSGSH